MERVQQLNKTITAEISPEEVRIQQITKEIEEWWACPRFNNVQRTYSARQVASMRCTIQTDTYSNFMAKKYYEMLTRLKRQAGYSLAYGALDPIQVINASKYLSSIYVSGWQCSSTASTTNEPGPDFADYPHDTVPNKCDQLIKMQIMQDKKQNYERSVLSEEERLQTSKTDYLVPLVCDADAGFGGVSSTMKLIKLFIDSGAAAVHLEDQRAGAKKCGHMGGKVVIPTSEHCQKLMSVRLQADIQANELFLIARTDALSARHIESNIDPIDHPYIVGMMNGVTDPVTYPEAGLIAIDRQVQPKKRDEVYHDIFPNILIIDQMKKIWNRDCRNGGFHQAQKLAKRLGFDLDFDWEACRSSEGFYQINGSVEYCAVRAKEYLKVADALWMETPSPDLKQAKELADLLKWELNNNKFLAYNCSPSFNWSKFGFSDEQLRSFNDDLAKLGYTWQFITLAGFHLNALMSEKFSKDLSQRGMLAYVEKIQKKEEKHQVDQLRHQKWSGADYVDQIQTMINQKALISQDDDSTENQFKQE